VQDLFLLKRDINAQLYCTFNLLYYGAVLKRKARIGIILSLFIEISWNQRKEPLRSPALFAAFSEYYLLLVICVNVSF